MKLLVEQRRRNVRKCHDRRQIVHLTIHKRYYIKLSFIEYYYCWRMVWEAIADTLALVRRLNDSLPLAN